MRQCVINIYDQECGQSPDQGVVFKPFRKGHRQKVAYTSPQDVSAAWFGDMPGYKEGAVCRQLSMGRDGVH